MTDAGLSSSFATTLWPSRSLVVAEVDGAGRIVAANPAVAELAGEDPTGLLFADLAVPGQRPAVEALLDHASADWTRMTAGLAPDEHGVPVDFELWARRDGDRTLIVAERNVHGVAALNSELLRLNDELIGARRDAARSAASERSARGRAESTAQKLRNLQQIVDTALTDLSLDDLLDELLDRLCQAVDADAVEALLVDENDGLLVVRASRGLPDRDSDDHAVPISEGLPGRTLSAARPLHARPVSEETGVSRALAAAAESVVSVPLRSSGRPVGVLVLGVAEDREFPVADIEMLELAAERIGTAIERVLTFERERDVASILQESLMPGPVPELDGLEVAARYRPAGVGHRVGGDFYDVFNLPDGRSVAVVGDVRGKGPEAAARTGLVRFTTRALAPREPSPAVLLGELNTAMLDQSGERRRHCSIVFAAFGPAQDGRMAVQMASGGHPLPLALRTEGKVESLGRPGSLVGLIDQVHHHDAQAELRSGDTVLFYTDGVTEARSAGGMYGEERLAELLERCAGLAPADVARTVEDAVADFSDGPLRDDIAIVAVRARP